MAYILKDKGVFQTTDGKALKKASDILDPECNCGINCCDGIIKLPVTYSSTLGLQGPKWGYFKNGSLVWADPDVAKADIDEMKVLIPPTPSPTPTPSVTPSVTPTPTPTPTPSGA